MKIVIDASGAPLGRISSFAAKQSLLGKDVIVLNCSKALITGKRKSVISEYKEKRQRGGSSLNGPHFPANPERVVKRTIRGMLPYKQGRGLEALKRVRCHNGIPNEYEHSHKIKLIKELKTSSISLEKLEGEI